MLTLTILGVVLGAAGIGLAGVGLVLPRPVLIMHCFVRKPADSSYRYSLVLHVQNKAFHWLRQGTLHSINVTLRAKTLHRVPGVGGSGAVWQVDLGNLDVGRSAECEVLRKGEDEGIEVLGKRVATQGVLESEDNPGARLPCDNYELVINARASGLSFRKGFTLQIQKQNAPIKPWPRLRAKLLGRDRLDSSIPLDM